MRRGPERSAGPLRRLVRRLGAARSNARPMLPGNFSITRGAADALDTHADAPRRPICPSPEVEPTKKGSWLLSDGRAPDPFEYRTANEATLAARARARAEQVSTVLLRDRYGRCHRIPVA